MIDAVLFDLDGTLLDRDASVLAFAREQHRHLRQALGHVPIDVYVERFVALDARGASGRTRSTGSSSRSSASSE